MDKNNREYSIHDLGNADKVKYTLYAEPPKLIDAEDNDPSTSRHYKIAISGFGIPSFYELNIKISPSEINLEFGEGTELTLHPPMYRQKITAPRYSVQDDMKVLNLFMKDVLKIFETGHEHIADKMHSLVATHYDLLVSEIDKYSKNLLTDVGLVRDLHRKSKDVLR